MSQIKFKILVCFILFSMMFFCARAQNIENEGKLIFNSELSHKTFGTAGKAVYPLKGGVEAVLYEYKGNGCLTHMWFGGNWKDYEKLIIRIYIDSEKVPSIEMELFMGHGMGFKDEFAPWGTEKIGKTGSPSGVYNNYKIPFGKSIRITAQLPEGDNQNPRFWYVIRGTENIPVEYAGIRLPYKARLKLHKLEDYVAESMEEFDICNTKNPGVLYQVTVAASSTRFNYLESMVRAYIGGSNEPVLLSSGLEDYFLGTYYFNRGRYYNDIAGLTHFDKEDKSFSAYRFHDSDPVFFQDGLRLTLTCGEQTANEKWSADKTKYTTYVWIYEW